MTQLLDAIVVGAGPAGSVTAAALAGRGHRVLLVDRARFPRDKPCGDYCDPGAVQALSALGCQHAVLAAGAVPFTTMIVLAQDGTGFEAPFPEGTGLLIPRRRLDATLLAHAARQGADVLEGTPVTGVRLDASYIEIHTERMPLRARLLVAADGMHSILAKRLGVGALPRAGRFTVGAYFSDVPQGTPHGELHLGPNLYCGVAHFGDGVANICMALPQSAFLRRTPAQTFQSALRAFPVLVEMLVGGRQESAYRCTGPVGFTTHKVVSDRVLLVGDAAGQIDPMTGQGIFFALRSGNLAAEVAADALAAGDCSHKGLQPYAVRRSQELAGKLRFARVLQALVFQTPLAPVLGRRLAAQPTLASEFLGTTGDVRSSDTRHLLSFAARLLAARDAHYP